MDVQASNLAKLTEVYNWRTPVEIRRENNVFQRGDFHTLKAIMHTPFNMVIREDHNGISAVFFNLFQVVEPLENFLSFFRT